MNRYSETYTVADFQQMKQQMLSWGNRFNICALLDNHEYALPHSSIECLLAVDAVTTFKPDIYRKEAFTAFLNNTNDWLFGHVCYDLKNQLEQGLFSEHFDGIGFDTILFFQPETVVQLHKNKITISCIHSNPSSVYQEITQCKETPLTNQKNQPIHIAPRISKENYLQTIKALQQHIQRGDCYEINFCQEFYAENCTINPVAIYTQLTHISPNPFSCYYKVNDRYLLCASPERYVKKEANTILSQPIKGTIKRNRSNKEADELLRKSLQNSSKDKSENVMIVDMVRNDLSKICTKGSVEVTDLFGVYPFPQVYQMISTVKGNLVPNADFADVLQASFPMGSMTGAPKKRVMQLTEQYEKTRRGIYSGCIGYITPHKDFDFNVVIRSIMYHSKNRYLSYQVGGGITFYSNPEAEYEECMLKAEAIQKVLQ